METALLDVAMVVCERVLVWLIFEIEFDMRWRGEAGGEVWVR